MIQPVEYVWGIYEKNGIMAFYFNDDIARNGANAGCGGFT